MSAQSAVQPAPVSSIYELVAAQAQQDPDAVAITAPGRKPLSYHRLLVQVEQVAATLRHVGVNRGTRVALLWPEGPELAVAFLSVAAGAACIPLNPTYRVGEFARALADLRAETLLLPAGLDSPVRNAAQELGLPILELIPLPQAEAGLFAFRCSEPGRLSPSFFSQPDDVALVLETSGTTSRPKTVALTHRNLIASTENIRRNRQLTRGDRCLNLVPLFHVYGILTLLPMLSAGASFISTPGFDASSFFAWLDQFRPTSYSAVPAMHQSILAGAADYPEIVARSRIRYIPSSGVALPRSTLAELERVFQAPVVESYGMSEAGLITTNPLPPQPRKPGSVGVPVGSEIAILDEDGHPLPVGQSGEVVVRGPSVFAGYENDPEANRRSFVNGWLRTGDQGYLDSEGYLFVTGRSKEMINRGGEKIAPGAIEEGLREHPAVAEVVVFGIPHPTLGEDVAAAVVLRETAEVTVQELQAFARTHLADHKVPARVLFVSEIPKGPTGKPQRLRLAEQFGLTTTAPRPDLPCPTLPRTPVEALLAEIWKQILQIEQVGVLDQFASLGGDSIRAAQLVNRVRDAVQIEMPLRLLMEAATIADQAVAITQCLAAQAEPSEVESWLAEPERSS